MSSESQQPLASTAPRRRYWSTYVVAALTLAVLVLANVPGQEHSALNNWTHGWPWTYLTRHTIRDYSKDQFIDQPWTWSGSVTVFSAKALLADAAVSIGILALVCAGWHRWRRQRLKVHHVHVRDLLAITAVVALACAWYVRTVQSCRNEQTLLRELIEADAMDAGHERALHVIGGRYVVTESILPSWLLRWLGQSSIPSLERVVRLDFQIESEPEADSHELARFAAFTRVEAIHVEQGAPYGQWNDLRVFPSLKSLVIVYGYIDLPRQFLNEREFSNEFAAFPELNGLDSLWLVDRFDRGRPGKVTGILAKSPNLRAISFPGPLSDDDLDMLGKFHALRELRLHRGFATPEQFRRVCALMPQLQLLYVEGVPIDDKDLSAIVQITDLKVLGLFGTNVSDAGLRCLTELPRLQRLSIGGEERVAYAGVGTLQRAMPNLAITYRGTEFKLEQE